MGTTLRPVSQNWDTTPETVTPVSIKEFMSVFWLLAPNSGMPLLWVGATYR